MIIGSEGQGICRELLDGRVGLLCDGIPACTSGGATLAAAVQLMEMGKAKRPLCIFAGRRMYE